MRRRGVNPVTGSLLFILLLFIWLVVGLTFLGPYVSPAFSTLSYGPPVRRFYLTCPLLAERETAAVSVIPNSDQQAHIFYVTFSILRDSVEVETVCQSEVAIQPGGSQTVTCLMNPVELAARSVMVTAIASEESQQGSCIYPCANSSRSACHVAPFSEYLRTFFGTSLMGLALLGTAQRLLRRVHRFIRPILDLLWLPVWFSFTLLTYLVSPTHWVVIPFLIPSAVLLVGWIRRRWLGLRSTY